MKKFLIATIILISFSKSYSLQAGLWKTNAEFKLNGLPMPSNESEACLSAAETKDAKDTIAKALKKDGCTLTKWDLKGTALKAALTCKNKDVDATGTITGIVTDKKYELDGDAQGHYKGTIPSKAKIKLVGTWVKSCKK